MVRPFQVPDQVILKLSRDFLLRNRLSRVNLALRSQSCLYIKKIEWLRLVRGLEM